MKAKLVIKDSQHWFEIDREEYNRAYEIAVLRHYFPPPKPLPLWRKVLRWVKRIK